METIKYNSMLRFVPQHFFPAEYECSIGVLIINNNMNAQRKIPQTPVTDNNRSEKEEGQPTKALSNATSSNITITLKYDFSSKIEKKKILYEEEGRGGVTCCFRRCATDFQPSLRWHGPVAQDFQSLVCDLLCELMNAFKCAPTDLNFYQLTDENLLFYKDGEGSA